MEEWYSHTKEASFPKTFLNLLGQNIKIMAERISDWLNTNKLREDENYWDYKTAKEFVQRMAFKNASEWQKYSKSSDSLGLFQHHQRMYMMNGMNCGLD